MDRIRNLKLRNSLFLYLVFFLTIGIVLSVFTLKICTKVEEAIWLDNIDNIDDFVKFQEEYNAIFQDFLPIPSGTMAKLTIKERVVIELCDFLETWCWFLFAFGGALAAVLVFYNKKLKQPLALLHKSAQEIGKTNLDCEIYYDKKDEMGELCEAFEQMREQLMENNLYLWNMIEEQKQLRAAFTHDIRTPLVVLKGYVQLLKKYLPEQTIELKKQMEILDDIEEQTVRLEQFSDSIKKTQRMDHLTIKKNLINVREFLEKIEKNILLMSEDVSIKVQYEYHDLEIGQLCIDVYIFMEVMENIVANALRYAKEKIDVREFLEKIEKNILLMSEDVSIKVQYEYHDLEIGQLCIDVYIFMEVMENIVANALRYAKEKIDVKIQKDGKFLKLLIMDDGKGFSERDIIHACRPYYREQSDEDTQHYGLGLYICKVLCEKHGGSIELGNNKFGGGCVQVIFNIEE